MKKKFKNLALIIFVAMLSACSSDDDEMNNSNNLNSQIQEITDLAMSGSWVIASFIDSGVDETDDFSGYVFTFDADGSLMATDGTTTIEGSWSITDDDSSDDDSMDDNDDIDFNIFFASPSNFSELTEDWEIVSLSSTRIELIHISGGDGGTDTLVFEMN